jgi:hypothetical protein
MFNIVDNILHCRYIIDIVAYYYVDSIAHDSYIIVAWYMYRDIGRLAFA